MTLESTPTPEETAELPDRVIKALLDNQARVRTLFRRWLIIASVVLGLGVGFVAWKVNDGTTVIYQIRDSQIANTAKTDHRAQCDQVAYHDLAFDLQALTQPGETPMLFLSQIQIPPAKC